MNVRAAIRRIRRKLRESVAVFDAEDHWRRTWELAHVLPRELDRECTVGRWDSWERIEYDPPPFPDDLRRRYVVRSDTERQELEQDIARRIDAMQDGGWVDVDDLFRVAPPRPRPKLKIIPDHPRWAPRSPRRRVPVLQGVGRVWCNDERERLAVLFLAYLDFDGDTARDFDGRIWRLENNQ
jgi:hypothetical protein